MMTAMADAKIGRCMKKPTMIQHSHEAERTTAARSRRRSNQRPTGRDVASNVSEAASRNRSNALRADLDTPVLNCYRSVTWRSYRPVTSLSRESWMAAEDNHMGEASLRTKPRSRIVETARDLFRKHGIKGIGVDAIAEAAGTNKMTLYRHFGSKDELIAECLRLQADKADQKWSALEEAHPGDPRAQLLAW